MVLRGEKSQNSCIDWCRLVGPMSSFREADRLLRAAFGEPTEGRGRHFYAKKRRYEGGAELWYESLQDRDDCVVDLSGAVLGALEQWESWQLLLALKRAGCWRCTRIDLAIDFRADNVELVQAVEAACERGELTGAKVASVMVEKVAGCVRNAMVRIGKRGKTGSGRFGRAYDKGLETKTEPGNKWHRLEIEYSGDLANQAFAMLVQAESKRETCVEMQGVPRCASWQEQARAMVLGSFDFREVTGSRELKRRPRAAWWASVVAASETLRLKAKKRVLASLDRTAEWVRKSVAPTVWSMADRTGRSPFQVLLDLVGDVAEVRRVLRPSVFQYAECHGMAPAGASVSGWPAAG